MEQLLKAKNVSKNYGNLKVLTDVNITLEIGEIVTIVGPSGAGKTTLLHILGTLDRPNKNTNTIVSIENTETTLLTDKALAKFRNQHMGFIFQFHELLPEFTALENTCIPGFIGKKNTVEVKKKGIELLTFLGLEHRINHKPNQLSGGEQQRVAVARALINSPSVILADEPSGNLDSSSAESLHQLFFELRNQFNQTFIIVTHNQELANMADRKLIMKDGIIL